jgi:hypothetical protein
VFAVGFRVVHGEPDLTGVPAPVRPVIDACLAKDPAARPDLGQLMRTVATGAAAYPGIAPGKFWPDQVSALLESGTFKPVLPSPTIAAPPSPTTHPARPAAPAVRPAQYTPRATDQVVRRRIRRGPRWLLPVALGIAVAIAAGIAIALPISPGPKPPAFLPGESGSPTPTGAGLPVALIIKAPSAQRPQKTSLPNGLLFHE